MKKLKNSGTNNAYQARLDAGFYFPSTPFFAIMNLSHPSRDFNMHIEINLNFQLLGDKKRSRSYTKTIDGDQMEMIEYMHSLREKHSCSGDDGNDFSVDIQGYRYVS